MQRAYYSQHISDFLVTSPVDILGFLAANNQFSLEQTQRDAWVEEIRILQATLVLYEGRIYFEYSIPRMGKRIDVVLLIGSAIFILEFKVGERVFTRDATDQIFDYALDLKNFHESSHTSLIAPILIPTKAADPLTIEVVASGSNNMLFPIKSSVATLARVIDSVLEFADGQTIDAIQWESGRYSPTPTIVEAAMALYRGHSVAEISRNDASAINLTVTTRTVAEIIKATKALSQKSICFVTGVPGAGKTLVGLNIATQHNDKDSDLHAVFLSGNGPLVEILREALTRDQVQNEKEHGRKITKKDAARPVKMFIQNVHNFRDECLIDVTQPPPEHIALFDEAQRAWDLAQTSNFMQRKKNRPNFEQSESEFLISCLDRHKDWASIVCLVGGGQEIHTGEAGIGAWIDALNNSFPDWNIYISSRMTDSEYGASELLSRIASLPNVVVKDELHLAVSMRSFRAENVSLLIKQLLDLEEDAARTTLASINENYPIVITRDLNSAKGWLRKQARGSERFGIVVSSQAQRLKPHAIDVKSPIDPIHWFLEGKDDVRSSYFLEDVATEFQVQGLELDWACVVWDADFRYKTSGWDSWSFRGDRWQKVLQQSRQNYLKNTYRVLLTRARQGMVIVVPDGDDEDHTRKHAYYDATYEYLKKIGFKEI
jgi:hypothetical protein